MDEMPAAAESLHNSMKNYNHSPNFHNITPKRVQLLRNILQNF